MKKEMMLSAVVAGILAAGSMARAQSGETATTDHKANEYKCEGANACKGKGECGGKNPDGTGHECAGKNTCKGAGWINTKTKADCDKILAKLKGAAKPTKKGS